VHITARTEYALRAMLALAAAEPAHVSAAVIAATQRIPPTFLQTIMGELRRANLVHSQRGTDGGYRLAKSAAHITVGEVMRVVDSTVADVANVPVGPLADDGAITRLRQVWLAADTAILRVVDMVTLADIVAGRLPAHVRRLASPADA
jgi:Rrf2 family protein